MILIPYYEENALGVVKGSTEIMLSQYYEENAVGVEKGPTQIIRSPYYEENALGIVQGATDWTSSIAFHVSHDLLNSSYPFHKPYRIPSTLKEFRLQLMWGFRSLVSPTRKMSSMWAV